MKIVYFRLKGYAGIYHGMGLDEVVIPFNTFTSNIILIRGENGCGKSTILNALSLEIDGSDMYRTDMIYDTNGTVNIVEYPAEKEIHLLDGGDIYKILIVSAIKNGKRATTKAYISRNDEELNPNGNVSSYKDIRNSILDMDPNYIALSMISSENRGLVDKIPSERKRFMSNVIGSLDFFNNCYKNLSKKSSIFRSNINNLKSKIYNLGDPDNLYSTLTAYNQRLTDLDKQKAILVDKIAECRATVKLLDPDNKIQDVYQSIVDELGSINSEMTKYSSELDRLTGIFSKAHQNNDIATEKTNIESALTELKSKVAADKIELSYNITSRDNIQSKIESTNQKIIAIQSDNIRSDIVTLVNDIKEKLVLYEDVFKGTDVDLALSRSELMIGNDILNHIKKNIVLIWDNDNEAIDEVINYVSNGDNLNDMIKEKTNQLSSYELTKSDTQRKLDNIQRELDIASIADHRPKDCTISDCYFIKEALSYDKDSLLYTQSLTRQKMDSIDTKKKEVELQINHLTGLLPIYDLLINTINTASQNKFLLSRLGKATSHIIDQDALIQSIQTHHNFNEFSAISEHLNIFDIVEDYSKQKELLVGYEADLKIYNNNKALLDALSDDMKQYETELQEIDNKIIQLSKDIAFNDTVISSMEDDLKMIESILEISSSLDQVKDRKKLLGEKFAQVKDDIAKVKTHVDELNKSKDAMTALENEYGPLKDNIGRLAFSIEKLESYKKDLATWMDQYDKVEFLKKACSPTTGIQSVFISIYMSQTIKIANELLSYLFGGTLSLLPPEINSDEFRIPFMGSSGTEIRDISMGSTSQKCMIGMTLGFSLMSQGSVKYNILRLDEIDGGLDTANRLQFVHMLLQLMDIMSVEQCIMCSHNIETETYNANVIYLSKSGIQFFKNDQKIV